VTPKRSCGRVFGKSPERPAWQRCLAGNAALVAVFRLLIVAGAVLALVASAATTDAAVAVRSGCPPERARFGVGPVTADRVIAVGWSRLLGQVTHYQGRTERRTRQNTPVEAVPMALGYSNIAGARTYLRQAAHRCGMPIARYSNVVAFHDGLSVIANATIIEFVVRTNLGWWAYGA
jgi:hypothetical protein